MQTTAPSIGAVVVSAPLLRRLSRLPLPLLCTQRRTQFVDRSQPPRRLALHDFVLADEQPLEQRLVEHAPRHWCRQGVGSSWVFQQAKRLFCLSQDRLNIDGRHPRPPSGLGSLLTDANLLRHQHLIIYQALVAELEQTLLFLLECLQARLSPLALSLCRRLLPFGKLAHQAAHSVALWLRQAHAVVVVALDRSLDPVDAQVRRGAVAPAVEATKALEVFVAAAVATHWRVDHLPAALGAEQRTLEVVLMLARPVATQRPPLEHLLHPLEGLRIDQRLVKAVRVLDAPQRHHPDVEVVAQHAMDRTARHGPCWPLLRHTGSQASGVQQLRQGRNAVLARGVDLKGPRHQRPLLLVDLDAADLSTEVVSILSTREPTRDNGVNHLAEAAQNHEMVLRLEQLVKERVNDLLDPDVTKA